MDTDCYCAGGKRGRLRDGDPSGDSMAGLAVLVYNDAMAVIVNIVGRVSIGKLIKVASRSNGCRKTSKKLSAIGNQTGDATTPPASKRPRQ